MSQNETILVVDDTASALKTADCRASEPLEQEVEALRQSQESLAITLRSIGDAVIATDADGLVTRMNPAAERLTGWPLADAVGRPLTDVFRIINAQTRQPAIDPVHLVMARGEVVGLANHTALLGRDGQEYQIADSAAPIRDPAGRIVGVVLVFSDVTEQYRAQRALHESEKRLALAFDATEDGLFDWDMITGVGTASEHWFAMHGLPYTDAIIPPGWRTMVHPDDVAAMDKAYDDQITGRTPQSSSEFRINVNGEWRWLRARGKAHRDAQGRAIRFTGAVTDITTRKEAELARIQGEQKLRQVLHDAHCLVTSGEFAAPADWRTRGHLSVYDLTWRSDAVDEQTVLAVADVELRPKMRPHVSLVAARDPEDDARIGGALLDGLRRGQERYEHEFRVRDRHGKVQWLAETLYLRPLSANSWAFSGTTLNITERKRSQEALQQSERLLSLFMQHSPVRAYIKSVTATESRMLLASDSCGEILGVPGAAMAGKTMEELFPPDLAAKVTADDWAVVASGQVLKLEHELDGRSYSTIKFPIIQGGKTLLGGYSIDITARKEADEALRLAKESAEAAIQVKNQFLAKLSHELRTPLTPALLVVSQWENSARIPAALRDDLAMVGRSLEVEARLLEDLLDVNRILYGKMSLRRERVQVHKTIGEALKTVALGVHAKRLELAVDLKADSDCIEGDPTRVQQIVWNLVSNAIKFTPEGGRITVSTCNEPAGHIQVRVADTGMGQEPGMLARLFKPFEQGSPQVNHQYGGMGLGLTISKSMTEAHGGSITAASEGRGKGATFNVRLPLAKSPVEAAPAAPLPPVQVHRGSAGPLRILLVEDNADTARIMSRLLRVKGCLVETAGDVASALACAERSVFDLLVSDLGLPDGSGLDLMRQLIASGKMTKGIAVSGFGTEDDLRKSREAGFAEHLVKPTSLAKLQAAIERVAGRRTAR